ncbi:hypothetical protein GCM10009830_30510 [Glycomyces endophyticus]|uniref:Uncharacterized protein n=1 Tax=Glycomyces endophyticus TaxID=480996 RepID=A0ABP4T2R9_9ACTN
MDFILPTDEKLRAELEERATDTRDTREPLAKADGSGIYFRFTQTTGVDPADVHGA